MQRLPTSKAQGKSFNHECILLLILSDKCTHVQLDVGNEAAKSGAGLIKTRPQGSSVFDGSRPCETGVERQDNDIQEESL